MVNILVLTDQYYPRKNANSICIRNIIHFWKVHYGDMITVVCFGDQDTGFLLQDENVYTIQYTPQKKWVDCVSFSNKLNYLNWRIKSIFHFPRINQEMVTKYLNVMEKISQTYTFDCVISLCNPPESVEAGFQYAKKHINACWIIYDIDTVTNRSFGKVDTFLLPILMRKAYSWECRMFGRANHIFHLQQHADHFGKKVYAQFMGKTSFLDLPLLTSCPVLHEPLHLSAHEAKMFLYAGRFYRRLREPWDMIEIVCNKANTSNFKIHIFTETGYVKKLLTKCGNETCLTISEYVSEETISQKIQQADFLLSVGNSTTRMFPSKIVTYVASGKPIIHFYSNDQDPVPSFLKPYPEKLLLDTRKNKEELVVAFNAFVRKQHHTVSFDTVSKLYRNNCPDISAQRIRDAFCTER